DVPGGSHGWVLVEWNDGQGIGSKGRESRTQTGQVAQDGSGGTPEENPARGRETAAIQGGQEEGAGAGRSRAPARATGAATSRQAWRGAATGSRAALRGALLRGQRQARRQGRADHGWRFGHWPRGGGAVRARGRRCRHRLSRRRRRCRGNRTSGGEGRPPLL